MKDKKFLVIPQCNDLNRGDQALVWETIRIAQEAGFKGKYYIMAGSASDTAQSLHEGFNICEPVLRHPSYMTRINNNIKYGMKLIFKWGFVSIFDLFISILILFKVTRNAIKTLLPKRIQNTLNLYEDSEAVFVKGGGFVHSFGGIISSYYIFFMLYHILLAHKFEKPVYIMPNSFGPFNGPFSAQITKSVLKRCRLITAREGISANILRKDVGINVQVFPDLGFFLQSEDKLIMKQYLIREGVPIGIKKCVAITMRPYRFPGLTNPEEAYSNYIKSLASFIVYLNDKGFHMVLVEHTLSYNKHENDGDCIRKILPLIQDCKYTFISNNSLNCRQLKSIYSLCDYVIGTRFHSVIFALGEGIPAIAITYGGNKGDGIMKDMGLSEYTIPINKISYNEIRYKFDSLVSNQNVFKGNIDNYLKNAEFEREQLIDLLEELRKEHFNESAFCT